MTELDTTSDTLQLEGIGKRLTQARIRMELTQAELAKEAGIGKRTVERLEAGESVQLKSFIRVLRVLELLDIFTTLLPDPRPTPMQMLKLTAEEPQRVYKSRKTEETPTEPWVWGEDR